MWGTLISHNSLACRFWLLWVLFLAQMNEKKHGPVANIMKSQSHFHLCSSRKETQLTGTHPIPEFSQAQGVSWSPVHQLWVSMNQVHQLQQACIVCFSSWRPRSPNLAPPHSLLCLAGTFESSKSTLSPSIRPQLLILPSSSPTGH